MEVADPLLGVSNDVGYGLITGMGPPASQPNRDGTMRLSSGEIGSSLNPFGCFDEANAGLGLTYPGGASPVPILGNGGGGSAPAKVPTTTVLSSLPPQKLGKKPTQDDTPRHRSSSPQQNVGSPLSASGIRGIGNLQKVKRRSITTGLRPKIVILSDQKDLIRVHLDSEESDSDILYYPRHKIKSARRMSISGDATNFSSSRESLHADTDEEGGTDNPSFVSDEFADSSTKTVILKSPADNNMEPEAQGSMVEPETVRERCDTPTISIRRDQPTVSIPEKSKSKRPKSAKHPTNVETRREVLSPESSVGHPDTRQENQQTDVASSKKDKKKRKERAASAKTSEGKAEAPRGGRPQTAFAQNLAEEVSSMTQLVAWDRPEDDV